MKVNLELIDLLRERANVSYEDAKMALERCENDIVEALIYLEKEKKIKPSKEEFKKEKCEYKRKKFKNFLHDVFNVKFLITKKGDIVLNLPLVIVAIFALGLFPLFILLLGIAILTGHKLKIKKGEDTIKVNKVFSDIKENINNFVDEEEEK